MRISYIMLNYLGMPVEPSEAHQALDFNQPHYPEMMAIVPKLDCQDSPCVLRRLDDYRLLTASGPGLGLQG